MPLDSKLIEQLRPLVESETGMDFSNSRTGRLTEALQKAIAHWPAFSDWEALLTNPDERALLFDHLTAELTVGESFFFRNEHHFQALRNEVLPDLLNQQSDHREIRLWSAGCAKGEEPYSLAILLDQVIHSREAFTETEPAVDSPSPTAETPWSISILGTDINHEFLQAARRGEYRDWSFRRTQIQHDRRYFEAVGDLVRVRPRAKEHVRFAYLNLVKDVYPSLLNGTLGLDLILFRNVAIYLQAQIVNQIVQRFFRCLRPGGWLLLGEAEVTHIPSAGFDVRRFGQATFLQKPMQPGSASTPDLSATKPRPRVSSSPQSSNRAELERTLEKISPPKIAGQPSQPAVRPVSFVPTPEPRQLSWEVIETALGRLDFPTAEWQISRIRDREQRAAIQLAYVRRLLELSQSSQARRFLEVLLSENPLLIEGHLSMACLAEEDGDLKAAETACRRAVFLNSQCAMSRFHLGLIQQQTGDVGGALKSLQLAIKLAENRDPNSLVDHGDGLCYSRLADMARSILSEIR